MRAQCVLVATTLLHSGAKFHSFLYTGSKTVRVNMIHFTLSTLTQPTTSHSTTSVYTVTVTFHKSLSLASNSFMISQTKYHLQPSSPPFISYKLDAETD